MLTLPVMFGLKDWFGAREEEAIDVPSHCQRDPSSEQVNK
jgi:hypothetical protein